MTSQVFLVLFSRQIIIQASQIGITYNIGFNLVGTMGDAVMFESIGCGSSRVMTLISTLNSRLEQSIDIAVFAM